MLPELSRNIYFSLLSELELLHRMEITLADSLEFEFAFTSLTKHEYQFLHHFCAKCYSFTDATGEVVTFKDLLKMLIASHEVYMFMRKNEVEALTPNHIKQFREGGILPKAKEVDERLGPIWQWVPNCLDKVCQAIPYGDITLRETILAHCITFIKTGIILLDRRKMGDGRRVTTLPNSV